MKVLLISPIDPEKPSKLKYLLGGESTYTRMLLEHPPAGVKYVHIIEALKTGQVKITFWDKPLSYLIQLRLLPISSGIRCLELKDSFDLVHVHGYEAKLTGKKPPVILSDSSSNYLFLRDYLKWHTWQLRIGYLIKRFVYKLLSIYSQDVNTMDAPLIVWSKFAKKVHESLGTTSIIVIPPGLSMASKKIDKSSSCNVLFIGTWFERKGGRLLLQVYKKLKTKYPFIRLTVIGDVPKDIVLPRDIFYKSYVSREELFKNIYPKANILVLVPPVAEGFGVVVLEAASFGIPAIVSSVYALPELVVNGKTGFVIPPLNQDKLYYALERIVQYPKERAHMGINARERFTKLFWLGETNKKLKLLYEKLIIHKDFEITK